MPKRFWKYSRSEPERTIMFCVSFLTLVMQALTLTPWVTPWDINWFAQLANVVLVGFPCVMGVRAAFMNSMPAISRWSFWLFAIWLFSGILRLAVSPDPSLLLWFPMIIIAMVLAVVHIFSEAVVKSGGK